MSMSHSDQDPNLVEVWTRLDKTRLMAGALAGLVAGALSLVFAIFLTSMGGGGDIWMPTKLAALPLVGSHALNHEGGAAFLGFFVYEFICLVSGAVFAHFTFTNKLGGLLGMGVTWGLFTWIFINNLFSPSFRDIYAAQISQGAALFVCLVFGLALSSVSVFDRMFRGN